MPVENILSPDLVRRIMWSPPSPVDAAAIAEVLPQVREIRVHGHVREVVVVQPGAAQLGLGQVETERLHQVQRRADARRQPDGTAGVAGDAGLEERDVQHAPILRIACCHAF